ncbi:Chromobox protein 5 [Entomophthora muscae]|uniref:Chromobox protein 5 n=1 Tax=Entomophthora muscae TaxID=34485 RepID=A0ACC2RJL3_9FUNG|nr:Chromobox protein 5 [Entomophthora muscae]
MGPQLISNVEAATDQAAALKQVHQELHVTLAAAITTYKEYTDHKRQEGPTYRPSDLVMVDACNMKLKGTETSSSQPILMEGELEYEWNCILASRKNWRWLEYFVSWKGYPNSKNSWVPHYDCSNSPDLIQEFYECNPTAIDHHELTLAAMKLLSAHKNFPLSHLLDGGIVPWDKAEDLNQTVD